jgi:hypothetical protein
MEQPVLLTFEKDWMCDPFTERYKIVQDIGQEGGDMSAVYKFKIHKV